MENLFLTDHVRLCRTLCDTVGLDLKRNRYFSLGPSETRVLERINLLPPDFLPHLPCDDTDPSASQMQRLIEALVNARIVGRGAGRHAPIMAYTDAADTLCSAGYELESETPLRWHHVLACLAAHTWALYVLRRHSLYRICRVLRLLRSRSLRQGLAFEDSRAIELVGLFRALRPFIYDARDRCLLHALTLTRFLGFYDLHPHWMIGVRTRPWGAHSWVQAGQLILDGRPDDVNEYTPILIV